MAEPDAKPADPKAAELKYTYPNAAVDDAAIAKVETAIAQKFPASYESGLAASTKDAPVDESEVKAKQKEANDQAAQEAKDHPDEVQKEAKEDPPGKLVVGAPVKAQVKETSVKADGPKDHKTGSGGGAVKQASHGGKHGGQAGPGGVAKPPHELVLQAAATGDGNIDKYLNDYPHKSHETTEKLSKIKEMAAIAKGFDGQVEGYVKNGSGMLESAKAGVIDFLGKKDVAAAFGENPYAKVEGGLGKIMRGLSRFQAVVSIVGNVCGKLGMVLTVVGLLGMIFPPVGALVSAVARVLNVVGIICDVLGLVLSGILTGLNGVVLAKQIGKGASNEEKAATADMMVTEATSAGGHVLSLAMTYGPKFMKGFKSASRGVIGQLFARFKSSVGKFATKALGPVANWAKNIGYKLGIGLESEAKAAAPGLLSKAWKSPATLLEKVRDTSIVKKINNSGFMQGVERAGGRVNNIGWVNKVDNLGENMGKATGSYGETGRWADKTLSYKKAAEANAKEAEAAAAETAAKDAGNRERAKIERDIASTRELGNTEYERSVAGGRGLSDESAALRSNKLYADADALEQGEQKAVADAENQGKKDALTEAEHAKAEHHADEKKEELEKARIKEFNKDPKQFQSVTARFETQREHIEAKLKAPGLSEAEKETLEGTAHKLEKTVEERRMIGMKASGGESPENLWQAKKYGQEWWAASHGKNEAGEKAEERTKSAEELSGHTDSEKFEHAERHEKIEEWKHHEVPVPTASQHVDAMLNGLDEELGGAGDPLSDEPPVSASSDQQTDSTSHSDPHTEPQSPVQPPVTATTPAVADAKEPDADVPELAYWPKLVGPGGDFAQAAKELQRMKLIAYAFHKSQLEAKKKAMETVATLATAGDDASKKQEHAQQHTSSLNSTIDEAKTAGASADKGTAQAQSGSAKQDEGQSSGHGSAQQAPDPGEQPSRWHPIKRLWWKVKKWASEKATKAFGWIQEKIASLVLQGLCGVSMGDMKAYTTALHHRMEFSKIAGTQGVAKANEVMAAAAKTQSESKTYAEQAMDDARECDQNIADADAFVAEVEATEKEIAAEQARAAQFLAQLTAAVQAERARQAEDKRKQAAEGLKLLLGQNTGAGTPGQSTSTAQSSIATPADRQNKTAGKKPQVSTASVVKVTGAAGYVVTQANLVVQQLTGSKEEQTARLRAAIAKKPKSIRSKFERIAVGDGIVTALRSHTAAIGHAMDPIRSSTPAEAAALRTAAGQVRSSAHELDDASTSAYEQLNIAFKSTYDNLESTQAAG
jgi:hypothetical protein